MNLNDNPTIEQFHDLLRQHDDRAGHHVLWVRKDGEVMLACLPKSNPRKPPTYDHPEMQMRYDTFPVGYGHVGLRGRLEDEGWWFQRYEVFKHMVGQWARLKGAAGMTHLGQSTFGCAGWPARRCGGGGREPAHQGRDHLPEGSNRARADVMSTARLGQ